MKRLDEPITVIPADGPPRRIAWRGNTVPVEALVDYWVLEGKWWMNRARRVYLRLQTPAGTLDVYRRNTSWHLDRVVD